MRRLFAAAAIALALLFGAGCTDSSEYTFTPDVTYDNADPYAIECGTIIHVTSNGWTTKYQSVGRVCREKPEPGQ